MIGWFNKNYVKDNKVNQKIGRMIYRAFEQRMKSDYNILHKFTIKDVKIGLSNLKEVIQSVNELLNRE